MSSSQYVTKHASPCNSVYQSPIPNDPKVDSVNDDEQENGPNSFQLLKPDHPKIYAPRFGKRHVQVLFYFIFFSMVSTTISSMPICLVAMTDPTSSPNKNIPTYQWIQKGTIISVFMWGYMIPQTLSGWLSSRYGGKWVLVIANGFCSLSTLLLPIVTNTFGFTGIVSCRFLQGFFVGFNTCAGYSLLAKWVPLQERSSLSAIASSGLAAGGVVITFASGYMAASWYGWPMVFYVIGTTQILLSACFAYFGYNSPTDHPTISQQELIHITKNTAVKTNNQILSTPWTRILTSPSFLSLVLVQCTYTPGTYIFLQEIPIYFNKVMEIDIESNSILSALPLSFMWFLGYAFSFLTDWLIVKNILSIGRSRKILVSIGFLVPSVGFLFLSSCDKNDITKATILIVLIIGFSEANLIGHMVNFIDLSPNHAGTLMGISNQLAYIASAVGILLVQIVLTDETDPSQWKIVFYFTSGIFAVTSLIFNVYGSGKVQPWNEST